MASQPTEKERAEHDSQAKQHLDPIILEQVMSLLGEPSDLQKVQVRRVWDDHYRVNVFVGPDVSSIRISDCFFLVTDQAGKIVDSTPKIKRRYEKALVTSDELLAGTGTAVP